MYNFGSLLTSLINLTGKEELADFFGLLLTRPQHSENLVLLHKVKGMLP